MFQLDYTETGIFEMHQSLKALTLDHGNMLLLGFGHFYSQSLMIITWWDGQNVSGCLNKERVSGFLSLFLNGTPSGRFEDTELLLHLRSSNRYDLPYWSLMVSEWSEAVFSFHCHWHDVELSWPLWMSHSLYEIVGFLSQFPRLLAKWPSGGCFRTTGGTGPSWTGRQQTQNYTWIEAI